MSSKVPVGKSSLRAQSNKSAKVNSMERTIK
jgi:hypothetical protein